MSWFDRENFSVVTQDLFFDILASNVFVMYVNMMYHIIYIHVCNGSIQNGSIQEEDQDRPVLNSEVRILVIQF